jgi:hypothetical protein
MENINGLANRSSSIVHSSLHVCVTYTASVLSIILLNNFILNPFLKLFLHTGDEFSANFLRKCPCTCLFQYYKLTVFMKQFTGILQENELREARQEQVCYASRCSLNTLPNTVFCAHRVFICCPRR